MAVTVAASLSGDTALLPKSGVVQSVGRIGGILTARSVPGHMTVNKNVAHNKLIYY